MGWLRFLLLILVARPLTSAPVMNRASGRERLPLKGPAIVAANHSSHVDTLLLLAIFPSRAVARVRPVTSAPVRNSARGRATSTSSRKRSQPMVRTCRARTAPAGGNRAGR